MSLDTCISICMGHNYVQFVIDALHLSRFEFIYDTLTNLLAPSSHLARVSGILDTCI